MPGPVWIALAPLLFADAGAMTLNLFLGVVLGVLVARLRWGPPQRMK